MSSFPHLHLLLIPMAVSKHIFLQVPVLFNSKPELSMKVPTVNVNVHYEVLLKKGKKKKKGPSSVHLQHEQCNHWTAQQVVFMSHHNTQVRCNVPLQGLSSLQQIISFTINKHAYAVKLIWYK